MPQETLTIGVLALQGDFREHVNVLNSISTSEVPLKAVEVRTPQQLEPCTALVMPGGESTTMCLLIQEGGLYEPLKEFVRKAKAGQGKSVWGTCAGMILLAKEIEGPTAKGWRGLNAMDVRVGRNSFGRQLQSFSHSLQLGWLPQDAPPYLATFIRAPLVHDFLPPQDPSSPPVEVLAQLPIELVPTPKRAATATGGHAGVGPDSGAILFRQGALVASSWHPELSSSDHRVHEWWVRDVVLPSYRHAGQA